LRFAIGDIVEKPGDEQNLCDYVLNLKRNLAKAYDIARQAIKRKVLEVKKYHDRDAKLHVYRPGDKVMVDDRTKHPAGEQKLHPRYTEPWFVIKRLSPVVYRLQQTEDGAATVTGHNRLEKFLPREEYEIPMWVMQRSPDLVEGMSYCISSRAQCSR
jgi:hypothetical protein